MYFGENQATSPSTQYRLISNKEWERAFELKSLTRLPQKNIYYSILHGIDFSTYKTQIM